MDSLSHGSIEDTASASGLSSEEAAKRLAQAGPNAVIQPHDGLLKRITGHFWPPVPWMLKVAIVLQIVVGERIEAAMIAALLVFNVALGMFQESRADAALTLLKSSSR
jgi:H+-transporting ATPase